MGSIRARKSSGNLFLDFRYLGQRCREQTTLENNPTNIKKLRKILEKIEAEITLGSFNYAQYFPNSPMAKKFKQVAQQPSQTGATPLFCNFAETWLGEMRIQWRDTHYDTVSRTFDKYLTPTFGDKEISHITKSDILNFRSTLAKIPGRGNNTFLSTDRINHIMTPLRMLLNEAADRYEFTTPYRGIKSLKVPKTQVHPFTLDEVWLILAAIRDDFHHYFFTRFFTAMRTSEIHGLKWKYIDFERRQILIRNAWVKDKLVGTKNDGSIRDINMSKPVYDILKKQHKITSKYDFVFCNRYGQPLNGNNIAKRIWHPLLRNLNFEKRRMYQTRHTAATLWLASGESPEWIARQMGHSSTEMLFRVYSRYVPNLTRNDGSAFERLLMTSQIEKQNEKDTLC